MPDEPDPKAPLTSINYKDDPDFLPWLKQQEGFKDLFTDPEPSPKGAGPSPTASGGASSISAGGGSVPANQAQDKMGDIVGNITKKMMEGAVEAARGSGDKTVIQQVAKKLHPIWGYEVD